MGCSSSVAATAATPAPSVAVVSASEVLDPYELVDSKELAEINFSVTAFIRTYLLPSNCDSLNLSVVIVSITDSGC